MPDDQIETLQLGDTQDRRGGEVGERIIGRADMDPGKRRERRAQEVKRKIES